LKLDWEFLFPLEKGVRGILDKKKISLICYNISQRAICYIELFRNLKNKNPVLLIRGCVANGTRILMDIRIGKLAVSRVELPYIAAFPGIFAQH